MFYYFEFFVFKQFGGVAINYFRGKLSRQISRGKKKKQNKTELQE